MTRTHTTMNHPQRQAALRRRLATVAVSAAFASVAMSAVAQAAPHSARQLEQRATAIGASVPGGDATLEVLQMNCAARVTDDVAGVGCDWRAPGSEDVVGVRLIRSAVGLDGRNVVYRSGDLDVTQFYDVPVRRGVRYRYVLQGVNDAGRIIASSRVIRVGVPAAESPRVEVMQLRCAAAEPVAGERAHIGCSWSLPTTAAPRQIALWRAVDGAARERVAAFGWPFATSYRDVVPAGTSRVVYAVIGTNSDGDIVSRSRADGVRLPTVLPVSTHVTSVEVDGPVATASPATVVTIAPTTTTIPSRDSSVDVDAGPVDRPVASRPIAPASTTVPAAEAAPTVERQRPQLANQERDGQD